MKDLIVTIIQADLVWENREKNLEHFDELLEPVLGTDLIVLPEMFTTGFSMNTKVLAETMTGNTMQWLYQTASKKNAIVCGSVIIADRGNYYNRLIWMHPDGDYTYYDKRHLFTLGDEQNYFTAGTSKIFPECNDWKILPLICYDLRFPVWARQSSPYTEMGNHPYDLLIYVANWPEKRIYAWEHLLIARAIEN
ncbi:MAG: nitrilase family protein, partial [Chitinophagales bacterium]|nr:nitrilase family protein [Chitinophagales bacterium]